MRPRQGPRFECRSGPCGDQGDHSRNPTGKPVGNGRWKRRNRPPTHGFAFVARDGGWRGVGVRGEANIPVHVTVREAVPEVVSVHVQRPTVDRRHRDSGLFYRFAKGRRRNGTVGGFNVTTHLDPELPLLVETQEDRREVIGEDEATRCDVGPATVAGERSVAPRVKKGQVLETK